MSEDDGVVSLPTGRDRTWHFQRAPIEQWLADFPLSDVAHARIMERMRIFCASLDRNVNFTLPLTFLERIDDPKERAEIRQEVQVDTEKRVYNALSMWKAELIGDRLEIELELVRALGI